MPIWLNQLWLGDDFDTGQFERRANGVANRSAIRPTACARQSGQNNLRNRPDFDVRREILG